MQIMTVFLFPVDVLEVTLTIQQNDDAVESIPLWLLPHDWRGVYTRRYTYPFSLTTDNPRWYNKNSPPEGFNRLFDLDVDPLEMNNLYDNAQSKALRDDLHRQALHWMNKFNDQGWSYPEIVEAAMLPEDLVFDKKLGLARPGGEGRMRGRPLDFLLKQSAR